MTRLRERSCGGVLLALVAMALQLVAMFGHVHLADISPAASLKPASVSKPSPLQNVAKAVSANAALDDIAALPPAGDGDVLCAVCLVGHLVASAAFAAPPVLVLPVAYVLLGPPQAVAVVDRTDVAASFWSRGPPLS